jgi:hypothetical protein
MHTEAEIYFFVRTGKYQIVSSGIQYGERMQNLQEKPHLHRSSGSTGKQRCLSPSLLSREKIAIIAAWEKR